MIFILGKTGSGKTTIVNELVSKYGFNKIITYTTRPMRNGETNHKDYHFINNKDLDKCFLDNIKDLAYIYFHIGYKENYKEKSQEEFHHPEALS